MALAGKDILKRKERIKPPNLKWYEIPNKTIMASRGAKARRTALWAGLMIQRRGNVIVDLESEL